MLANVRNIKHEMKQFSREVAVVYLEYETQTTLPYDRCTYIEFIKERVEGGILVSALKFSVLRAQFEQEKGESFVFLSIVTPPANRASLFSWNMST
jgi:hypothetical protein